MRAAKKPIGTLAARGPSINMASKQPYPATYERSDVCALPAASVIVENAVAFEIAGAIVEKYVGTSVGAIRAAHPALHELNRCHLSEWVSRLETCIAARYGRNDRIIGAACTDRRQTCS